MRKRLHVKAGGYVQGHRPQPRSDDDVLSPLEDQARRPYGFLPGQEQGDGPTRAGRATAATAVVILMVVVVIVVMVVIVKVVVVVVISGDKW